MRRDTWSDTRKSWLGSGIPFTIGLMVLQFLGLILVTSALPIVAFLIFYGPEGLLQPWRVFTYPFLTGPRFFSYLFTAGLTYWFCSSLERSWSTRNFAIFYVGVTVVSALSLSLGGLILQRPLMASDMIPVAAAGVAWGLLNAEEQVCVWFIPMKGIFIALISVLVLVFDYADGGQWLTVPFALGGCALSYFWVRSDKWSPATLDTALMSSRSSAIKPNLRLVPPSGKPKDDRFTLRDLNPFEIIAKRRRRKQFEKLMGDD